MSLKVTDLTKTYNGTAAVNKVSFSLAKGEIVGFLGPNGAGKSTTMKMIMGIVAPEFGQIEILGQEINQSDISYKKHIGYLPEHNPLYLDMYVKAYLEFAMGISGNKINKTCIDEVIQKVGLSTEQHKKIKELSKGYRQRVGLAQALIHKPIILILDEPTTGLDPNQLVEIRELIKNEGKDKTVLFSTHILQEVEAICDRVIIINKGSIMLDAQLNELRQSGHSLEEIFKKYTN